MTERLDQVLFAEFLNQCGCVTGVDTEKLLKEELCMEDIAKEEEIEIAKKLAFGEQVDYSRLKTIKNAQEVMLKNMGLNGTDISPNYECKFCGDTGYIKGVPCECLKKEINKELKTFSGFTHRLANFDEDTTHHPAYEVMKKWCDTKSNKINVVIAGNPAKIIKKDIDWDRENAYSLEKRRQKVN